MSVKAYEESNIRAIANAIRQQLGVSTLYTPAEMAAAVLSISGGGGTSKTIESLECIAIAPNGKLWGDANGDGTFDESDTTAIANYVINDSGTIDTVAADINQTGYVNVQDLDILSTVLEEMQTGEVLGVTNVGWSDGTTTQGVITRVTPPPTTLGGTVFKCNKLNVPSDSDVGSDSAIYLPHGLGRTPTSVIMWTNPPSAVAGGVVTLVFMGTLNTSGLSYFNASGTGAESMVGASYFDADATNIMINLPTGTKLPAGWTYYWFAI